MQHISCTTIHDYKQTHIKAEKICYKVDMATKCVVGVN